MLSDIHILWNSKRHGAPADRDLVFHSFIHFIHSVFQLESITELLQPCLSIAAQWLPALRGNCWALCFLGSVFVHGTTCFTL